MYKYHSFSKNVVLFLAICIGCFYGISVLAYINPTADAGSDQYVNFADPTNTITVLHGRGYEPNGGYLTYTWYCNGGYLSNPKIAEPVFTMPSNSQSVSYNCNLTVTSNFGLSASDNVIINVNNSATNNFVVKTEAATNNYNNQAILRGSISSSNNNYNYGTAYVWFEWGPSLSYGHQSNHKVMTGAGSFEQHIAELLPNTTYHFRSASQLSNGQIYYGSDTIFATPAGNANIVLAGGIVGTPTDVSTGLTNDFLTDSFFLPLLIALIGTWMYISGMFASIEEWLWQRKSRHRGLKAAKKLQRKITQFKNSPRE